MTYQLYKRVSFGTSHAGLGYVGYQLYNSDNTPSGSRITAGVFELSTTGGLLAVPTINAVPLGGSLANSTYAYVGTQTSAGGETTKSAEVEHIVSSTPTDGGTHITSVAEASSTGLNIYRGAHSGPYGLLGAATLLNGLYYLDDIGAHSPNMGINPPLTNTATGPIASGDYGALVTIPGPSFQGYITWDTSALDPNGQVVFSDPIPIGPVTILGSMTTPSIKGPVGFQLIDYSTEVAMKVGDTLPIIQIVALDGDNNTIDASAYSGSTAEFFYYDNTNTLVFMAAATIPNLAPLTFAYLPITGNIAASGNFGGAFKWTLPNNDVMTFPGVGLIPFVISAV